MSEPMIVKRAEMALSDLTTAGVLVPEQANTFIRTMQEQPTILNVARVVPMPSPKMEINKIQFASRILKPATQTQSATQPYENSRYLAVADRSKPTTSKITLDTKEVIAEIPIPYEVLEDNIEKENFSQTLLAMIAQRASQDLEELIIQGDTGSGDSFLALMNGVLALTTTNVVDALGDSVDAQILANVVKAQPQKFRVPGLQYFVTSNCEVDIRTAIASRNTGLGDGMLTGQAPVMIHGYKLQGIHKMPLGKGIFVDPRNIVVGFHRQLRLEMDRNIRSRELVFVLTARVDVKLEEETAVVKMVNLAS